MKKVILSLALVAGATFAAQAQATASGTLTFQVNDFISMTPSGAAGTVPLATFNNPTQMQNGIAQPGLNFAVSASRSWSAAYSASDFVRTAGGSVALGSETPHNIAVNVPVGAVMNVMATGSAGVGVFGSAMAFGPVSNGPTQIVSSLNGGLSKAFTVLTEVKPGFTYNLEGTYATTASLVASLD